MQKGKIEKESWETKIKKGTWTSWLTMQIRPWFWKKKLRISLRFIFGLWSFNYCKLIKLNFLLQNWELTRDATFSQHYEIPIRTHEKKKTKINHKFCRTKLENKEIEGPKCKKFQGVKKEEEEEDALFVHLLSWHG
jgi:hypothetical protein